MPRPRPPSPLATTYSDASCRRSAGTRSALTAEGEVDGLLLPVPDDRELHLVARAGVQQDRADRLRGIDLRLVDLRDDVVRLEAGLRRRRARKDLGDDDPLGLRGQAEGRGRARGEQAVADADRAAIDLAVLDELVGDGAHGVAGDGEPEPFRAGLSVHERVHADDLLRGRPDERPAGVALVDRGVGLDQILEHDRAVLGEWPTIDADMARGLGVLQIA